MPLFSALLNYRHSGGGERPSEEALRAWEGWSRLRGEERTNYPLTFSVDDLGGRDVANGTGAGGGGSEAEVCEFMERTLEGVVEALEKEPGKAIRRVEVLPEGEREQIVYKWNETEVEYPREKCVQELFEEQVERTPEGTAVVFEGSSLSYRESLNRRANQVAHYLRRLGVKPDARVGDCSGAFGGIDRS